ncbi:lactamase [Crepidotus variabilis]|uniref:Lactamase n=1 Tax=Crepidotus variabilis TaxID=179855 RepID=A0A9P6ER08_9AGAR|nr:lactamase [Crepidotus variabilis]
MSNLEDLGNVTRLSNQVVRVLGQNPGKFTLQGTNTYLVGSQNPYILVDAAQGIPEYIPVLESALKDIAKPANSSQPDISDIIISHWHTDHVDGLPSVLALLQKLWESRNPETPYSPPRLHKYPIADGLQGGHTLGHFSLPKILSSLLPGQFTPSPNGGVIHDLSEGQIFKDHTGTTLLSVLHTPGHSVDSIALFVPQDRALYTADTVLGHGTAVFENLTAYLLSLKRMRDFEVAEQRYDILYPGHGPVVKNGRETITTYIQHRLDREKEIMGVIKTAVPDRLLADKVSATPSDAWTTWNIVRLIYQKYPENLWLPACRGVELHLRKLQNEGMVVQGEGEGVDTQWKFSDTTAESNL